MQQDVSKLALSDKSIRICVNESLTLTV